MIIRPATAVGVILCVLISLVLSTNGQTCNNYTFSGSRPFSLCNDLPVLNSSLHWNYIESVRTIYLAYRRTGISSTRWVAWAINPTATAMVGSQALVAFQADGRMNAYTSPIDAYGTGLQPGNLSFPVPTLTAEFTNDAITIYATLVLPEGSSSTVNQVWQEGPLSGTSPGLHDRVGANMQSMATIDFLSGQILLVTRPGPAAGMTIGLRIIIGASVGVGGLLLLSLLIIFRRKFCPLCYTIVSRCRRKIKGPTNVELFLENNYGCLSLQNYIYSDIKKMTDSFKDKLGQGGYGSVFKGKLRNGQLVAVKVLNESKGKGEDFINEVATICRTNHVNVVSLLGFCAEGTKRALVYEFMQNGSLEKFIHNAKDSTTTDSFLGWERLYQITLGIARGLEYLHRGCNTRILHFDIKPHNILLDKDFCPKIADFGLAKLCPTRESLVSMVGARGTIGYIAPEICCRNFGGVSHKSDVYSYGMMVLEMAGGRKNIDPTVENISEIYFPQWIYRKLIDDIKVEGSKKRKVVVCGEAFAEEVSQKMIIVALWCIQAHPGDRPSMTKVVEMLEGNTEDLQLPPNPFPDPSSKPFSSSS